jgi:rhamnogalacturonyl hydrolase YesR
MQEPNGFFHAADCPLLGPRQWLGAGMAELLRLAAEESSGAGPILKGYRTMMASLLKYQNADGLWRQLVDHPEVGRNPAPACLLLRWLPGSRMAGGRLMAGRRKAWLGLVKYINSDSNITDVCIGTNSQCGSERTGKRK